MIAVIDDDESVRKAIARLLKTAGYSSRSFASGTELLGNWLPAPPDCLVLDLQMPRVSGLDVLRKLKAAGVSVSTIMVTASDEQRAIDASIEEGASVCLRKPVDARSLLAALERAGILPDQAPIAGYGAMPPK